MQRPGSTAMIHGGTRSGDAFDDAVRAEGALAPTLEARAAFLTSLSHELRTPLNAVVGFLDLLTRTPMTPAQAAHVAGARRSAQHILELVGDVLDHAKLEGGSIELEKIAFDPHAALHDAVSLVEPSAAQRGVRIELDVAAGMSTPVRGDPLRVRQVVLNLLSNAVKFTRTKITVHLRSLGEIEGIAIEVDDDGPGLRVADHERVFEPYRQAGASIARRHGGTGLGLSISRRLARAMGGELTVVTMPGSGCRFRFVAPLHPARLEPKPSDPPRPTAQLRSLRVLLADDDPSNRLVSAQLLEILGHQVEVADDGKEALSRALRHRPDLLILDVEMPGLDGTEVARRARLAGLTSRILGFTGHASPEAKLACRRSGMDDVLEKPADLEKLSTSIARVMDGYEPSVDPPPVSPSPATVSPSLETPARKEAASPPASSAGVDVPELDRRVGGDHALRHDVLVAVRDESTRLFAELQTSAANADLAAMRILAHTLKGCVANVGAQPVRDAVVALELAAKSGDRDRSRALLDRALALGQVLRGELERAIESCGDSPRELRTEGHKPWT